MPSQTVSKQVKVFFLLIIIKKNQDIFALPQFYSINTIIFNLWNSKDISDEIIFSYLPLDEKLRCDNKIELLIWIFYCLRSERSTLFPLQNRRSDIIKSFPYGKVRRHFFTLTILTVNFTALCWWWNRFRCIFYLFARFTVDSVENNRWIVNIDTW